MAQSDADETATAQPADQTAAPVDTEATEHEGRQSQIDYPNELARKAIHVVAIAIPVIYYTVEKEIALLLLVPLFTGFLFVDIVKLFFRPLARWYYTTFGSMLRPHELATKNRNFNGATYVSLSALLVIWFYPKLIAIAALSILILADTAAALVGRKFGKTKIFSKTLEGTAAFILTAIAVVAITPKLNVGIGVATALVAAVVELFPIKILGITIDDNLTIPLIAGGFMFLCYVLFLPQDLPQLFFK